jgi:hypothetical protein
VEEAASCNPERGFWLLVLFESTPETVTGSCPDQNGANGSSYAGTSLNAPG